VSPTYIRKLCHDIGLATGVGAHMGHLRRTATDPFDDRDLHPTGPRRRAHVAEEGDDAFPPRGRPPAENALVHLPSVTIAPSAARNVATGAPVYAPGVIDVDSVSEGGGDDGTTPIATLYVACHTPDGAAVCLSGDWSATPTPSRESSCRWSVLV